jgi:hypothetical protein
MKARERTMASMSGRHSDVVLGEENQEIWESFAEPETFGGAFPTLRLRKSSMLNGAGQ